MEFRNKFHELLMVSADVFISIFIAASAGYTSFMHYTNNLGASIEFALVIASAIAGVTMSYVQSNMELKYK